MIPLFDREQLKVEIAIVKDIKKLEKIENPTNEEKQLLKDKEKELKDTKDIYKAKKKLEKQILKDARKDSK